MEDHVQFFRDTWAEINLDRIKENVTGMRERLSDETEIIAVVKANAYGHGDVQVARTALQAGATRLAVAFMDEGLALRKKGIKAPIIVLGVSRPQDVNIAAENHLTLTVFQGEWLKAAKETLNEGLSLNIHIKLDTGMGRIGVKDKGELELMEETIRGDERFHLEGVYTHFATADELDLSYFKKQQSVFSEMLGWLKEKPKLIHASNSAAALRDSTVHFNAVRMGIAMYGLTPSIDMEDELPYSLQEAFSLHTRVVHVKQLKKGEKVSYGATYEAAEDEWIATLPIGYADGWIRKLQGQEVLIDGIRVPIVGRICMDQCMIKIPKEVAVGTIVTLIGEQKTEKISVNEVAKKLETINYEVICMISNRVPRVYKEFGKMVELKNSLL